MSKASVVAAHRDKLRWLARQVQLEVVVPERWQGSESLDEADGFVLHPLPVVFAGHNHFHVYRGLARVVDDFGPDVVHLDEEPYSAVTFQGGLACARRGLPFVFFAAQNIPKRYPPPFHGMRRWVFRRAAGGIAGTHQAADVLRRYGFANPLRVIPQMGVDPELFRPDPATRERARLELDVGADSVLVGFVGRLVPEKGVDLLLEAVARVPGVTCMITGSGGEGAALLGLAERLGVSGRVRFLGQVPSLDVPALLTALDVLCLPSRDTRRGSEQFGRVLVEAMSTEVPVVVTGCGGMPAVVGACGRVVRTDDVDGLTEALASLASDAESRRALGRCGRARVGREFSQAHVVEETVLFYDAILRGAT